MKSTQIKTENLEWLVKQPLEMQYELFQNFIDLAKIHYNQFVKEETEQKAGSKHDRGKPYSRWGSNPGSIRIGAEKVPVRVQRLYDKASGQTEEVDCYQRLHCLPMPSEDVLKKVVKGLSQQDYHEVTKSMLESFGISQSTISRRFMEESEKQLKEFEQRDLGKYDFIALFLDGKYLSKEQIVIALGVTISGNKIPLGFIHTTTENSKAVKGLLSNLVKRNFRFSEGLLAVIDGSKGLKKAVEETFGTCVLIQRCQWHKRENVVSYLNEKDQQQYRGKLQRAYNEPEYEIAQRRLEEIYTELTKINHSAANSLKEGLEETLTLHRLGVMEVLGESFATANLIESLNSQLAKYLRKVKYWMNADMKARWVAVALLESERKMKKIDHYKKLPLLRKALQTTLNIKCKKVA